MSTSKTTKSASSLARFVRPTVVVTALALGAVFAHAADDKTSTMSQKVDKAEAKTEAAVSDSWITTKVKSEILANSVSKAFKVSVTTKSGAVALKGKLPNQDAVDLVKMIAEKVKGVQSVDTSGLAITG